jgi:serine/threonine-protein kinase
MKIIKPRLAKNSILIKRYQILDEIGQGGMQQVYFARDLSLNRNVALKIPINASAQKRFERSARLSANIVHPNIAKTLDYANESDFEFLIEELIEGSDLQQRLDRDFIKLDPHVAAHITHHIVKAIAAMNQKGIVHRDLKPSNIMVSNDMGMLNVKVTDFGVAAMADAEIKEAVKGGQDSIVGSQTVVGALAFMAPELILKDDGADRKKCDVWSLGALLYFFLFGEYPFGNELAAIQNILNGKYPDRTLHVNKSKLQFRVLIHDLWEIIKRCLVMSVDKRPSAAEITSLFSKVTYSGATRKLGSIKYLNDKNLAWGFIESDEDEEDVFFHFDSYFGDRPTKGARVSFAAYPGLPQARAFPVVPCKA